MGFKGVSPRAHLLVQVSQLPSGLLRFRCQLCCADLQHVCSTNTKARHPLGLDRKQTFLFMGEEFRCERCDEPTCGRC